MTLRAITSDLILVFHIARASFARDSFKVKVKLLPLIVTFSSLDRLEANELAYGESTDRRTDHKRITPLRLVHQRSLLSRTRWQLAER